MTPPVLHPSDWDGIKFVAFDVDGTLYNQRLLRVRMVRDMLFHAMLKRNLRVISVLRAYRRIRERVGEEEVGAFETALFAETATAVGCSPEAVRVIVAEWIEQRPLPYLASCRYPGLFDLFDGLRRKGKTIGILSDYPAHAKLAALGLAADYVVSAGDDGIGFLKPHTRGLEFLIGAAGVKTDATVLIGDRKERDGLVAQRVGVRALIRSCNPIKGWQTFASYDAPLFAPLLAT
jgi:putative hydrolase of the HAD superfamily